MSNYLVVLGIGFEILLLAMMMSFFLDHIIRRYLHRQFDAMIKRLVTESYGKNLWEGITGIRHMEIQWMMENELRSTKAEALPKPIGTHRPFPHFDGLLLNPVQLHRRPVEESTHVDLKTVLGKKSKQSFSSYHAIRFGQSTNGGNGQLIHRNTSPGSVARYGTPHVIWTSSCIFLLASREFIGLAI